LTRMYWLTGGLGVVVLGILLANFFSSKNPQGWGAMKYPQLT
jgi:FHS family L-fucose permease-like MFS transporter